MNKEEATRAANFEGNWSDGNDSEDSLSKEEAPFETLDNVDHHSLEVVPETPAISVDTSVQSTSSSESSAVISPNTSLVSAASSAPSSASARKVRKGNQLPKPNILAGVSKEVVPSSPTSSEEKFSVDVHYYPTHNAALQLKPEHDDRIFMSLYWEDFQRSLHTQCEIEVKNSLYIQKMEEYINRSLANSQASGEGIDKSVRPFRGLGGPKTDKKSREPVTFVVRSTSKDLMNDEVKKLATLVISVYYKKNYAAAYFLVGKKNADYKKIRSECARVGNKLQCKVVPLRGYSHKKEAVYLCCTGTSPQSAESNLNKAAEMMGMKPDEAKIVSAAQVVKASHSESSSNGDYTMTFTI